MFFRSRTKYEGTQQPVLIGIDAGSSVLRIMAGAMDEYGVLQVLWYKTTASAGIYRGTVGDLNALSDKLSSLLEDIPEELEYCLRQCLVTVSGNCIVSENVQASVRVQNTITAQDCRHCREEAWLNSKLRSDKYVQMHADPHYFIDDVPVAAPLDLAASKLDAQVHLILCSRDLQRNINTALHKVSADIMVDRFVFSGLAAAEAVLSDDERRIGVGVIDIGASTVNVAVYMRGRLVLSFGLNRGGENITRAIAMRWGLIMDNAERVKCQCGVADPALLNGSDAVKSISVPQQHGTVILSKSELASCIGSELQDLFRSIRDQIERRLKDDNNMSLQLGAGFVLTGGVARTEGIEYAAGRVLPNGRVRVLQPADAKAEWSQAPQEAQPGPDLAVLTGMLRLGFQDSGSIAEQEPEEAGGSRLCRMIKAVKAWLEKEL